MLYICQTKAIATAVMCITVATGHYAYTLRVRNTRTKAIWHAVRVTAGVCPMALAYAVGATVTVHTRVCTLHAATKANV